MGFEPTTFWLGSRVSRPRVDPLIPDTKPGRKTIGLASSQIVGLSLPPVLTCL